MTTIAYKEGIMASDTMGNCDGDVFYGEVKLAVTDRYLLGFSGQVGSAADMYLWITENERAGRPPSDFYRSRKELPDYVGNSHVLIYDKVNAELWSTDSDGNTVKVRKPFYAIGSGSRIALGAMYAGATAKRAVNASIELDLYTGGDVVTVDVKTPVTPFECY